MPKFRKKPVVIEAFQITKGRPWPAAEWPTWLQVAWCMEGEGRGSLFADRDRPGGDHLCIGTLEGPLCVSWNDWIIQGVQGELYPCKPDIFEATYEPVK